MSLGEKIGLIIEAVAAVVFVFVWLTNFGQLIYRTKTPTRFEKVWHKDDDPNGDPEPNGEDRELDDSKL